MAQQVLLPFAMLVFPIGVPVPAPLFPFQFNSLQVCQGKQEKIAQALYTSCHLCRQPGWSSWNLSLAWSRAGCYNPLGNEPAPVHSALYLCKYFLKIYIVQLLTSWFNKYAMVTGELGKGYIETVFFFCVFLYKSKITPRSKGRF